MCHRLTGFRSLDVQEIILNSSFNIVGTGGTILRSLDHLQREDN
jgi:hypothetical protein